MHGYDFLIQWWSENVVIADDPNCLPIIPTILLRLAFAKICSEIATQTSLFHMILFRSYIARAYPNLSPNHPCDVAWSNIVPNSHQNIPMIMSRSDIAKVCPKLPPKHPLIMFRSYIAKVCSKLPLKHPYDIVQVGYCQGMSQIATQTYQ